ncbi:MAG: tetratricopeptide repeat protein, partial [Chitinophagales bacterium]
IYTNIVLLMPDTMAERFMFMPSLGFCIAFIFGLDFVLRKMKSKRSIIAILTIVISAFFLYKTTDRNSDWKNGYTLAVNTIEYAPENATLLAQYGTQLNIAALKDYDIINQQQDAEIERSLKHAIELFPGFYSAQTDLATFYSRHGRDEDAFPYFLQAIELAPTDWINHYYIGFIYNKKGDYDKTIYHLEEALKINEGVMLEGENILAEGVLARAYFKIGEVEKSIKKLEDSYAKYGDKDTYITLANQYQEMGNLEGMLKTLLILQKDFPGDTELSKNIILIQSLLQ